jgi:crotonobetainyl-CoA:carnitine CoA-transferase CaiB-like acyl-CoA transferase
MGLVRCSTRSAQALPWVSGVEAGAGTRRFDALHRMRRGGFDLIAQGMGGGIMHVTGEPDGPPTSVGLPICDLGTGMWAVQGILAALYERQRTGKGRLVECSLLATAIGFSSWTSAQWLADHEEPTRQGSRHRQNAPYQRMQTKNGYLMVEAADKAIWARSAKALGHPEWCEDPRFATNQQRMANREALPASCRARRRTRRFRRDIVRRAALWRRRRECHS